jgi:hypothetical protein
MRYNILDMGARLVLAKREFSGKTKRDAHLDGCDGQRIP